MRTIEHLKNERVCAIVNKIPDSYFLSTVEKLNELYVENTEDGDILFLDTLIGLEPRLKRAIRRGHISEKEMDYFIEFYGSIMNDENI